MPTLAVDGGAPVRARLLPYGHQTIDDTDIRRRPKPASWNACLFWEMEVLPILRDLVGPERIGRRNFYLNAGRAFYVARDHLAELVPHPNVENVAANQRMTKVKS